MTTAIPSIACLGVIGRNNNPMHISIFPSQDPITNNFAPIRTPLQFSLILSSTIDVFELRTRHNAISGGGLSGEYGLLQATNTGVRFVCVVDMRGRRVDSAAASSKQGLRDAELKPVFRAMQNAYVRLLQNPFYSPDEHAPLGGNGGKKITSRKFVDDMKRIGDGWTPGVVNL
ncbi:unnamed protein product [Clonostachys rosea f. rosea IK726]|uniref:Longin domain-containing protein n=2 Tax=Bionectria ochroleuca TaxID=29856 RepID=A0A0B7JS99_BIOOC|nr:unnamed protein product [Clonostachys rosea f. rosea IK726]